MLIMTLYRKKNGRTSRGRSILRAGVIGVLLSNQSSLAFWEGCERWSTRVRVGSMRQRLKG